MSIVNCLGRQGVRGEKGEVGGSGETWSQGKDGDKMRDKTMTVQNTFFILEADCSMGKSALYL